MPNPELELLESTLADNKAAYGLLKETITTSQHFVVWAVGIASPGMLGVLANAESLREMSRLGQSWFAILFGISEVLFVASIVVAVVFHRYSTRQLMLTSAQSSNIIMQASIWREPLLDGREELTAEEERAASRLRNSKGELETEFDRLRSVTGRYPFIQYSLLIAAYVVTALMFATSRP